MSPVYVSGAQTTELRPKRLFLKPPEPQQSQPTNECLELHGGFLRFPFTAELVQRDLEPTGSEGPEGSEQPARAGLPLQSGKW